MVIPESSGNNSNVLSSVLSSVTFYHITWDWVKSGDSQADISIKAREIAEPAFHYSPQLEGFCDFRLIAA